MAIFRYHKQVLGVRNGKKCGSHILKGELQAKYLMDEKMHVT